MIASLLARLVNRAMHRPLAYPHELGQYLGQTADSIHHHCTSQRRRFRRDVPDAGALQAKLVGMLTDLQFIAEELAALEDVAWRRGLSKAAESLTAGYAAVSGPAVAALQQAALATCDDVPVPFLPVTAEPVR